MPLLHRNAKAHSPWVLRVHQSSQLGANSGHQSANTFPLRHALPIARPSLTPYLRIQGLEARGHYFFLVAERPYMLWDGSTTHVLLAFEYAFRYELVDKCHNYHRTFS